jgi:hypothetical protein
MKSPSPASPVPATSPPPLLGFDADQANAVSCIDDASRQVVSATIGPRSRPAAALLTLGAAIVGADAVVLPMLDPSVGPHPVVQGTLVGVMLATAIGVRLGWRPARRVARVLGYALALGAYSAFERLTGGSTPADLWVAGVLAAEAGALGFMMNCIGWVRDEE